jgi:hypothetical protein
VIANRVELLLKRRQLRAYIQAEPISVVFHRREKIRVSGGWKWGPEQILLPQEARLVPAKRRYGDATTNTEAGQVANWPYILVGYYDMDVQPKDWFEHQGDKYEVQSIEQDRDEKTNAFVDYFGGES